VIKASLRSASGSKNSCYLSVRVLVHVRVYGVRVKERKMLAGHTGELLLGVMSIVIAVVVVWLLVYAAARGSARREEDRRRQQRNQEP
jgi:hypothetical protein